MILSEGYRAPEVQRDTAMVHLRHTCQSCEVFWKQLHPKDNEETYVSTILPGRLLIDMVFLYHWQDIVVYFVVSIVMVVDVTSSSLPASTQLGCPRR